MILAVSVPEKRELVICAAATVREQKEFLSQIERDRPELIQATDDDRFFMEADLSNFKVEPTILEFPDTDAMKAFVEEHEIELTNFPNAHGRQRRMLELEDFNADTGGRTLAEIHGLVENDPWDRRTPEEKAEAEERKKKMQEKAKAGDLTGDSWGGGKGRSMTSTGPTQQQAEGGPVPDSETTDDGQQIVVNPDGSISIKEAGESGVVDARPDEKTNPNATGGATGGEDLADEESGGLRIRDIKVRVNDDGTIEIEDVLADKDLFAPDMYHLTVMDNGEPSKNMDDYTPLLKRSGLIGTGRYMDIEHEKHEDGGIIIQLGGAATVRMNEAIALSGREVTLKPMIQEKEGYGDDNVYKIANDALVGTYFRVDALDRQIAQVNPLVVAARGGKLPYRARDLEDGGSWHAYIRRADAEKTVEILTEAGAKAELAEVDHLGERIVEEGAGAEVVDRDAAFVEPPAPWNEQRDEFYALSEEEQVKAMHKLLPFLLYSMRDYGYPHRIIVHITPRTYFQKHDKLWEGELPLEKILPDNFEKFGEKVGVYQVKSLDMNTTDFLLGNKAGMRESLMLRAHLNGLGDNAV